jgi:hypothetical protein
LVSARAFSEAGGVEVVEAGDVFVSFLLEAPGSGVPVEGPVDGGVAAVLGEVEVSVEALVAGAGVVVAGGVFVFALDVSVEGVLLLQPVSGSTKAVATRARRDSFFIMESFQFTGVISSSTGCLRSSTDAS